MLSAYIKARQLNELNLEGAHIMNRCTLGLVTVFIGLLATTAVNATPILCSTDITLNRMSVDDSQVSACVDSGVGNINGNMTTDDFLNSGGSAAGYVGAGIGGSFTQTGSTGTWSIAGAADAIGFKFGTGNQADEWFIYDLVAGVTAGNWEFINVFNRGGGLSHVQTYCKAGSDCRSVPEPGMVALLAIGVLGMVVVRRRMKV
ncbi:MAG: PEP-CTERM sorting domain-containing protein [Gammaproteobacteria bacterium]|nr:PEP-CTERM sorting domain-containing protein [Gammaproteobacteria bacterium]